MVPTQPQPGIKNVNKTPTVSVSSFSAHLQVFFFEKLETCWCCTLTSKKPGNFGSSSLQGMTWLFKTYHTGAICSSSDWFLILKTQLMNKHLSKMLLHFHQTSSIRNMFRAGNLTWRELIIFNWWHIDEEHLAIQLVDSSSYFLLY